MTQFLASVFFLVFFPNQTPVFSADDVNEGTAFRIKPYLFLGKDQRIKIGWSYREEFQELAQTPLYLYRGQQPYSQIESNKQNDFQFSVLPFPVCDFGEGFSYFLEGMEKPQIIENIPCNPTVLKTVFISDTQEYASIAKRFGIISESLDPHFVIHAGDHVQNGNQESEWEAYLDAMQPFQKKRIMIPAIGNHDYRGNREEPTIEKYFQMKTKEAYYKLTFGKVDIFVLNSCFEDDPSLVEPQVAWLNRELAQIPGDHWKIAFFHHPPYSQSIGHTVFAPRKEHVTLRKYFIPIFEANHFDLILNGHVHLYELSHKEHIPYISTGPAGGVMGTQGGSSKFTEKSLMLRTLFYIEIMRDRTFLKVIDENNQVIDNYFFQKDLSAQEKIELFFKGLLKKMGF